MIPIDSPPIPEPMISASKGLSVSIGKEERLFHAVFLDKFRQGADRGKGADPHFLGFDLDAVILLEHKDEFQDINRVDSQTPPYQLVIVTDIRRSHIQQRKRIDDLDLHFRNEFFHVFYLNYFSDSQKQTDCERGWIVTSLNVGVIFNGSQVPCSEASPDSTIQTVSSGRKAWICILATISDPHLTVPVKTAYPSIA